MKYLGHFMLATPFVGLGIAGALTIGMLPTLLVFGGAAFTVMWMNLGAFLVEKNRKKND